MKKTPGRAATTLTSAILEQQLLGGASRCAPLLDSWPEPPPLPLFCTASEFELAGEKDLAESLDETQRSFEVQRRFALEAASKAGDDSLAEVLGDTGAYLAALALVGSRALLVRAARPIGTRYVLCPLIDIAKYAPPHPTRSRHARGA